MDFQKENILYDTGKTSLTVSFVKVRIFYPFYREKTITEAQSPALSAEIVFLATTNDSSAAYVATDITDTSAMLSWGIRLPLTPPGARHFHCHAHLKDKCPWFSSKPVSYMAFYWWIWDHVTMLQLQRILGKQDRFSHYMVYFLQCEGRIFTRCKLARKRTNSHQGFKVDLG